MKKEKIQQILLLFSCIAVLMVSAFVRDKRVLGYQLSNNEDTSINVANKNDTIKTLEDGTIVINTINLGKDITGYAGQVPLNIYLKDGIVIKVEALKNSETPDFFSEAKQLLTKWNGKTIKQAQSTNVDAISGATFSSRAIIGNMQKGLQFAAKKEIEPSFLDKIDTSWKNMIGLAIVLMGAIIPLFYKNKHYRTLQLVLNVIVLGLWCGTFLSMSLFVGYLSSGINLWISLIPIIMLITAFIYPLFGKKNYYCVNICPCGSLQDLAGKVSTNKWKISKQTTHRLNIIRQVLFSILIFLLITGIWSQWMDYEVFTAFIFNSASIIVLVLAVIFLILSLFVARPYCRFVCPTGTLFKIAQNSRQK